MKRVRTDLEFLTLRYCPCLRGWIWCFFCTALEVCVVCFWRYRSTCPSIQRFKVCFPESFHEL